MKRLTKSDREWFLIFLQDQIREETTNSWRYKTKEQYGRVARLKRIYNILSYENPEAITGKEKFFKDQKSHP